MGLRAYIVKRIIYSIILIFFVISINFIIFMLLPGDPTDLFLNTRRITNPEELERQRQTLRNLWGIGDAIHIRYAKYVLNMFTWQFGDSMTVQLGLPVNYIMMQRLPNTLLLMGGATILAIIIGVILGVIAAYKRGSLTDTASVTSSVVFYSLPTFWMAMMFILIFYTTLHWLPIAGAFPREWAGNWPNTLMISGSFPNVIFSINPAEMMRFVMGRIIHLILPITTLTLFLYGGFLLLTRATMLEALTEDYIVTARAKGVPERTVLFRHALKNASLPLITSIAISLGFVVSGALITETVYTWPGIGGITVTAIDLLDYNILQAIFYVIAFCVILANFIADILYGIIDPRIKYG